MTDFKSRAREIVCKMFPSEGDNYFKSPLHEEDVDLITTALQEAEKAGIEKAKVAFKMERYHLPHGCVPKEDCENQVRLARDEALRDAEKTVNNVAKEPHSLSECCELKSATKRIAEAIKRLRDENK